MTAPASRQALIAALRQEVGRLEMGRPPAEEQVVSTGSPALDRLLSLGGMRRGTLVEYLTGCSGSGAGTLALAAARAACGAGRALVVLDQRSPGHSGGAGYEAGHFYPPAAAAWGIDLSRLLVLRPANEADALWALDQALRCSGVGAVWARWKEFDARDFRRFQLAAEEGGTVGLFIRPASRRGHPTWAEVQWLVTTVPSAPGARQKQRLSTFDFRPSTWRLRVELVRSRGAAGGQSVLLALDAATGIWDLAPHATDSLPLPAELADPAAARRA
jgi:protein ImuA